MRLNKIFPKVVNFIKWYKNKKIANQDTKFCLRYKLKKIYAFYLKKLSLVLVVK